MSTISPDASERADGLRCDPASLATRRGASDLEAVTGPMPVVDVGDGHLHVSTRRGVTIVEVDGGLDDALATTVVDSLERVVAGSEAVVVDLDRATLLDRTALETLCAVLDRLPPDVGRCLVASRLSGRLVLERWRIPSRFVVFTSVPDALQAREFIASGYGDGWSLGT